MLKLLVEAVETGTATLPSELREMVFDSLVHTQHATQVISNILDYSKLRTGKFVLQSMAFELPSLVATATVMVRHLLVSKPHVKLVTHLPSGTRQQVAGLLLGAPFHYQQILLNLLSNACKHTERGTITLTVDDVITGIKSDPTTAATHRTLRFSVADTGPGVPPERRALIFQEWGGGPSGAGSTNMAGVHAGSGLGLPLCCALLQHMGSALELAAPAEGTGAIFSFVLTLERAATSDAPATAPPNGAATQATPRAVTTPPPLLIGRKGSADMPIRMLIADDIKINRSLLVMQLRKVVANPVFVEVDTGEAALASLNTSADGDGVDKDATISNFDVAFLDEVYGEGKISGLDVSRELRARSVMARTGGPLPIVGCTGNAGPAYNEDAIAKGQNLVWGKPYPSVKQMHEQLAELLLLPTSGGEK